MAIRPLKICCEPASEFGTLEIKKLLYCDYDAGMFKCFDTETPCVPSDPEMECSPPIGEECEPEVNCCFYSIPVAGTTAFVTPGGLDFNFTENGEGLIEISFSISATACTTVVDGTDTVVPIEGDRIHAYLNVDLRVLGTGCEDEVIMQASPSSMTNTPGTNEWEGVSVMGVGGAGSLVCGVDMTVAFGAVTDPVHPCWPRNVCYATIIFSGYVRAEDSMGDPKDFAISSGEGYGFDLVATVTGTCCGPHDVDYIDVDPLP